MAVNWTFDASQYQPHASFELVPPGRYKVSITEVTQNFNQNNGFAQIVMVVKPFGQNGQLRNTIVLYPKEHQYYRWAVRNIGNMCDCFGLNVQQFLQEPSIAVGAVGFVDVKHTQKNGKTYANIDEFVLRSDLQKMNAPGIPANEAAHVAGGMTNPAPINPEPMNFDSGVIGDGSTLF